jgi:hypothetical protein
LQSVLKETRKNLIPKQSETLNCSDIREILNITIEDGEDIFLSALIVLVQYYGLLRFF